MYLFARGSAWRPVDPLNVAQADAAKAEHSFGGIVALAGNIPNSDGGLEAVYETKSATGVRVPGVMNALYINSDQTHSSSRIDVEQIRTSCYRILKHISSELTSVNLGVEIN